MKHWGSWLVVLLGATGACSGPTPQSDPPPAETRVEAGKRLERIPGDRIPARETGSITGEVPEPLLEAVVADAARRSGVAPDRIDVIRGEALVWSDGSLGCGRPDEVYTQAPVPGYRIVVDAGGGLLDYRATRQGAFRLCEPYSGPELRVPEPTPLD